MSAKGLKTSYPERNLSISGFQSQPASVIVFCMQDIHTTQVSSAQAPGCKLAILLESVKRQDRGAFETLYDSTVNRLYSLAFRITRQHETTEEVVSDVYLQVWQQAGQYDSTRGNVIAWLTVLCRSRALDALRRTRSVTIHESARDTSTSEATGTEHPQDLLIAIEAHSSLHRAVKKLDEQQRQLLALAYFRGYSHGELAQFTGLPLGTVKTQLRRTLMVLKSELSQGDDSLGEVE